MTDSFINGEIEAQGRYIVFDSYTGCDEKIGLIHIAVEEDVRFCGRSLLGAGL